MDLQFSLLDSALRPSVVIIFQKITFFSNYLKLYYLSEICKILRLKYFEKTYLNNFDIFNKILLKITVRLFVGDFLLFIFQVNSNTIFIMY